MNLGGAIRLNRTGFFVLIAITILLIYAYSHKGEDDVKVVDLRHLLTVSIKAAQNGGVEVVAVKDHLTIENKGMTLEGVNDSVTTADYRSHCIMMATLKHSFPDIMVVSEESKTVCDSNLAVDYSSSEAEEFLKTASTSDFANEKDVTIWIDPLDATKEYTEKLYEYVTTTVCVAVKGKPIIGVIYKPFSKELSWAWVGKSHLINVENKQKPKEGELKIVVSRSHTGDKLVNELKQDFKNANVLLKAGAGFKALEVAAGNADAYIHATAIKKWDICAGNAILNALGGRMTTRDNKLIDYSDTINVVNSDGVVATLKNHELFIKRL